jgi:hypothetical protein
VGRQRDSKLVGTFGNVIFYNFRGTYSMRTKPVSVQRTDASINSGLNFGKASKISAQIRKVVTSINTAQSDMRVLYRLTAVMNKFIAWKEKKEVASIKMPYKLPFIYGFQFNDQADLDSITAIQPSVKTTDPRQIEISLLPFVPSQSLHTPANTNKIILKMILMGVGLANAETNIYGNGEIEIPYTNESIQPPVISIAASAKTGDLLMLVIAVRYMAIKNGEVEMVMDKRKMPCGVGWAAITI